MPVRHNKKKRPSVHDATHEGGGDAWTQFKGDVEDFIRRCEPEAFHLDGLGDSELGVLREDLKAIKGRHETKAMTKADCAKATKVHLLVLRSTEPGSGGAKRAKIE